MGLTLLLTPAHKPVLHQDTCCRRRANPLDLLALGPQIPGYPARDNARARAYARDTNAVDLSDILASLGQPYDNLSAGPGAEFGLPAGSSNETLFKRLESAGRITIVPKVIGRGRKVQTLV
jgi:hypothetical protein